MKNEIIIDAINKQFDLVKNITFTHTYDSFYSIPDEKITISFSSPDQKDIVIFKSIVVERLERLERLNIKL